MYFYCSFTLLISRMKKLILLLGFLSHIAYVGLAQNTSVPYKMVPIQFSGVTITSDGELAVPFATILIKNRYKGAISDSRGFFSFVAIEGDTIQFSGIGYKTNYTVIPRNLETDTYSIIQIMENDTTQLQPVTIYPFPTREQFRQAFLDLNIPDNTRDIAEKNLADEVMTQLSFGLGMDAAENQRNYLNMQIRQLYYAGGQRNFYEFGGANSIPIPAQMFSPLAWTQFIKGLKKGSYKIMKEPGK